MHPRQLTILGVLVVGGMFMAGLFIHGWLGGVLLLITAGLLVVISRAVWAQVPAKRRPLRIVIIAAIALGGLVKLFVN